MVRADGVDLEQGGEGEAFEELVAKISDPAERPEALARLLDALADAARPRVVRRLGPSAQRALYEKVAGFASVQLVDLVTPDRGDLEEVRHLGRNTLPAFRIFEKRLCRLPGVPADRPGTLAGYNHQAMSVVTGPGYFVARDDPDRGEVLIDYGELPEARPPAWPPIQSNERGLARFVYGFMIDRLRRVSEHVTIGSAARKGREMGSYFVLARVY